MKNIITRIATFTVLTLFITIASCSKNDSSPNAFLNEFDYSQNSFSHNGLNLNFEIKSGSLADKMKKELVENYFIVYPKLMADFNPNAPKTVYFEIRSGIDYPAYASGNRVTYKSEWLKDHPEDRDVSTHEMMHLVQAYNFSNIPSWVTEGIADYVRDKYGLSNEGWSLQAYRPEHNYDGSYGITGRFLKWIELKVKEGFVQYLDNECRGGRYSEAVWKNYTGKTVQELWNQYKANPAL